MDNISELKQIIVKTLDTNKTYINQDLKEKKSSISLKSSQAILIGLDKITAKSSQLIVNLNESKLFGPLEIKILPIKLSHLLNLIKSTFHLLN